MLSHHDLRNGASRRSSSPTIDDRVILGPFDNPGIRPGARVADEAQSQRQSSLEFHASDESATDSAEAERSDLLRGSATSEGCDPSDSQQGLLRRIFEAFRCRSLAHDQVEELERKNEWLKGTAQRFMEENISLRRDVVRLEEKIAIMRSNYENYIVQQNAEISRLLEETSEQRNGLQAQTTEFARELEDLRSKQLVKAPSMCDSEVQGEWKALDFEVRQIFDAQSGFWAGDLGKIFGVLNDQVSDHVFKLDGSPTTRVATLSQLHDWRFRSTHLISRLTMHDMDKSMRQTAGAMLSCLGPVLRSANLHDPLNGNLRPDALRIVRKAAMLDRTFRLSKVYYHVFITRVKLPLVHPPNFGFQFDPETMEFISDIPVFHQGNDVAVVDLAVNPGIFEVGNSDGTNYGSERVLAKLQVLCNLQGTLERFELLGDGGDEECKDEAQATIKHEVADSEDDPVVLLQFNN